MKQQQPIVSFFLFHLGKCAEFDEEAYAFYTGQILLDARKNARLTQEELAKRIGTDNHTSHE